MNEVWKDIEEYEGLYQVSNTGKVKSLAKEWVCGNKMSIRNKPETLLVLSKEGYQSKNSDQYLSVTLSKRGVSKKARVHILVATYFKPNPENKPEVNHLDADRTNNNDWNLEWSTRLENMQHANKMGLITRHKGDKHHLYGRNGGDSISAKIVIDTNTGIFYGCVKEAAEANNINYSTLRNKLSGNCINKTSLEYA